METITEIQGVIVSILYRRICQGNNKVNFYFSNYLPDAHFASLRFHQLRAARK